METCEFTPIRIMAQEQDDRLFDLEQDIRTLVALTALEGDPIDLPEVRLTLSAMETRAFLASFEQESSFRADYNAALRSMVAIYARLRCETEACRRRQETIYLWQGHAAALEHLIDRGNKSLVSSRALFQVAVRRGMTIHVAALDASCARVENALAEAEALVQLQMAAPSDLAVAFSYLPEQGFAD